MGNHDAGHAMGRLARELSERRKPDETALALLDRICEPWRHCDAEWEGEPTYDSFLDPRAPLGRLMVEAFAPNGLTDLARYEGYRDDEAVCDRWYDEVRDPFTDRYDFW